MTAPWTPEPCAPGVAAHRAKVMRQYAALPDATPAERRERLRRADLYQEMAKCGGFEPAEVDTEAAS